MAGDIPSNTEAQPRLWVGQVVLNLLAPLPGARTLKDEKIVLDLLSASLYENPVD